MVEGCRWDGTSPQSVHPLSKHFVIKPGYSGGEVGVRVSLIVIAAAYLILRLLVLSFLSHAGPLALGAALHVGPGRGGSHPKEGRTLGQRRRQQLQSPTKGLCRQGET